jgi:hypothetical protein
MVKNKEKCKHSVCIRSLFNIANWENLRCLHRITHFQDKQKLLQIPWVTLTSVKLLVNWKMNILQNNRANLPCQAIEIVEPYKIHTLCLHFWHTWSILLIKSTILCRCLNETRSDGQQYLLLYTKNTTQWHFVEFFQKYRQTIVYTSVL